MIALLLRLHARLLAHPALLRRRTKLLMHKATRLRYGGSCEWVSAQLDAINDELGRRLDAHNARCGEARANMAEPREWQ